jgi:hypothetical protein
MSIDGFFPGGGAITHDGRELVPMVEVSGDGGSNQNLESNPTGHRWKLFSDTPACSISNDHKPPKLSGLENDIHLPSPNTLATIPNSVPYLNEFGSFSPRSLYLMPCRELRPTLRSPSLGRYTATVELCWHDFFTLRSRPSYWCRCRVGRCRRGRSNVSLKRGYTEDINLLTGKRRALGSRPAASAVEDRDSKRHCAGQPGDFWRRKYLSQTPVE